MKSIDDIIITTPCKTRISYRFATGHNISIISRLSQQYIRTSIIISVQIDFTAGKSTLVIVLCIVIVHEPGFDPLSNKG